MATFALSKFPINSFLQRFIVRTYCSSAAKVKGQPTTSSSDSLISRPPLVRPEPVVTTAALGSHRVLYKHDPEMEKDDPYYAALSDPDYFKTANLFTVRDLVLARVHLGHKVGTVNPAIKKYLFGERLDVCVFDLDQTAHHLKVALNFLAHVAYRGGIVLFVTNDRWQIHTVEKAAKQCGEYSHCHKFRLGTFTNAQQMFRNTIRMPDVVIFMSAVQSQAKEHFLVDEAAKMNIATIGVVDSNCSPNLITYPIPGNDDSLASCRFFLKMFTEAIRLGKQKRLEHFGVVCNSGGKPEKFAQN